MTLRKRSHFFSHHQRTGRLWEYIFKRPLETSVGVLEKRIASLHHYSDCSAMDSHAHVRVCAHTRAHTHAWPAISLIADLYTSRNTFHDHMGLYIEGYLISVNRFYRRWKYWKHFRLLRDFGRVVFQVDIKLQRFGVIFQNAPTDRRSPSRDRRLYGYRIFPSRGQSSVVELLLKLNYRISLTSTSLYFRRYTRVIISNVIIHS